MHRFTIIAALIAGLTLWAAPSVADPVTSSDGAARRPVFDRDAALAESQAAIGRKIGEHSLIDRRGRAVSLADYRGKPLVVTFIYTACSVTCPLIIETLADAVEVARDALGDDSFAVATVGFDTANDTPSRMRLFAAERGVNLSGWRFLGGDHDTVAALAAELGFRYRVAAQGFDHIAQTTVIDAQGVVYRQIYGSDFTPQALTEPLKELVFGNRAPITSVAGLFDRVRLVCTLYDPSSGRYRFDYSIFIGLVIGLASLTMIGVILVRGWWRTRPPRAAA